MGVYYELEQRGYKKAVLALETKTALVVNNLPSYRYTLNGF